MIFKVLKFFRKVARQFWVPWQQTRHLELGRYRSGGGDSPKSIYLGLPLKWRDWAIQGLDLGLQGLDLGFSFAEFSYIHTSLNKDATRHPNLKNHVGRRCRDPRPRSGPAMVLMCGDNNKHMNLHSFNFPQVSAVRISHTLKEHLHCAEAYSKPNL